MKKRTGRPVRVGNRTVGAVRNGVFRKSVVKSRHLLRAVNGYAFDVASIEAAVRLGAEQIELREMDTGIILRTSIRTLLAEGRRLNLGHGEQIALSLEHWKQEDPAQMALF